MNGSPVAGGALPVASGTGGGTSTAVWLLGGLAVLNLDGVHTRYEDSAPIIKRIAEADKGTINALLKEVYREPVKPKLIAERIKTIKAAGVPCAVSTVPARAEERADTQSFNRKCHHRSPLLLNTRHHRRT